MTTDDQQKIIQDPAFDVKTLPYEKAIKALEAIVSKIEKGEISLEESVRIYERGQELKKHCLHLLEQAEARIQVLSVSEDGEPTQTDAMHLGM